MSICDKCIHDDVCGLEDNHEEGIVSCADMIPKDVLEKIKVEITEEIEAYRISDWEANDLLADGLQMALNIIDGAIEEGEES